MDHPYKSASDRAFWKRAFTPGWETSNLTDGPPLIRHGEKVASAGSCFAANIIPFLERAGFEYIRRDVAPAGFANVSADNFNYSRFSAAYGNIYTARQAAQMFRRSLGRFRPAEDRWVVADDLVIDPFRPGLRYPATSNREFDLLTAQHLANVLDAVRAADVFVFTLGLTESWISTRDGAVFPACPGTIAGIFDPARHVFHNFSASEVAQDLEDLIDLVREVHPRIRVVLTVSPVPLVATATEQHVLVATTYSKSVLRVAAGEVARIKPDVTYFPAYEIVTGPQAPFDFFETDRREPSAAAISAVMRVFLSRCETDCSADVGDGGVSEVERPSPSGDKPGTGSATDDFARQMSALIAEAQCEEAAAGL
jgi:GSCFA family